jgi:glutamine amidotransferase
VLAGRVRRIAAGVKHPQMQWNVLDTESDHPMFAGLDRYPWVYFVHSYAPEPGDEVIATCDYGGDIVAAVARGPLWATQFHPEKSSATGLALLANFVRACELT